MYCKGSNSASGACLSKLNLSKLLNSSFDLQVGHPHLMMVKLEVLIASFTSSGFQVDHILIVLAGRRLQVAKPRNLIRILEVRLEIYHNRPFLDLQAILLASVL